MRNVNKPWNDTNKTCMLCQKSEKECYDNPSKCIRWIEIKEKTDSPPLNEPEPK